jgi:hypothetical protein
LWDRDEVREAGSGSEWDNAEYAGFWYVKGGGNVEV